MTGYAGPAFRNARTAKELYDNYPETRGVSGYYAIFPFGPSNNRLIVYADMVTDGGGWQLVARSHPGATAASWGWNASRRGAVDSFSDAYNLGWIQTYAGSSASFTNILYGNRGNKNDNSWGPFKYKISGINYTNFTTLDTQQGYTGSTIAYDLSVYNTTSFPGMQSAIGYYSTGTTNNNFYMRDCCGYAGYGGFAWGFNTAYINHATSWAYSGPWGRTDDAVDGNGNFTQTTGNTNYGGTRQYLIFVK